MGEEAKQLGSEAAKFVCQKNLKIHNKQGLNSPNVGWAYLPNKNFLACYSKAAYTLAEVILVIGIIGIVAALTIPQLIQNTNNKDLVSAFLKSNNVLANAYKNAKAIDNIHKMAPDDFKKTFKEYLKTYECDTHDICLQDSMFVDFTCDETTCTELTVNTNGDKKPNQAGKDKFKFNITQDGIIPQGEQEQCSGYDCGMYTLTYHKIFEGLTPNCVAYHDGKCSTCDDGFHLEENKTCSEIDFPTCAKFEGESCTKCKIGYAGSECDYCATGYKTGNTGKCDTCDIGYKTGESGKCDTCIASSHYKNSLNVCVTLPTGCSEAISDGTCTGCINDGDENRYYLKNAGICEKIPTYCSSMQNDGENCILVSDGTTVKKVSFDNKEYYMTEFIKDTAYPPYPANSTDYWAGAMKVCADKGMFLPDLTTATKMFQNKTSLGIPSYGFWTSTEENALCDVWGQCAYPINMTTGETPVFGKAYQGFVVCLGDVPK